MVIRIDNRIKKHTGRNIALGMILGIVVSGVGVYLFNHWNEVPIIETVTNAKNMIVDQVKNNNPITTSPANNNNLQQVQIADNPVSSDNNQPVTQPVQSASYSLDQLKQVALDDVNNYRTQNGLKPVSLGTATAPQKYSELLLSRGCINHISPDGLNPLGRYKASGDTLFSVGENLSGGYGTSWMNPTESIKQADHEMMFNDADQGNLHKANILDPSHISVSFGIAYNTDKLILVQDFEDPYIGDIYQYNNYDACW